jgi:hypothetical protein
MSDSILFSTPAYGGMVFAPHFKSCMNLTRDLTLLGIDHEWHIRWNESLVHRARMGMTKTFLDSEHSHMMWLDADIDFTTDDVARLWNMDADIAVGVYRMKTDDSKYAAWHDGKLVTNLGGLNEKIEVDYAGTGFMMIKRHVLEDLAKHVESYDNEVKDIPALYQTPIRDRTLLSEDYFFCDLARKHGYKIMMDTKVKLGHWGIYRYGDQGIS